MADEDFGDAVLTHQQRWLLGNTTREEQRELFHAIEGGKSDFPDEIIEVLNDIRRLHTETKKHLLDIERLLKQAKQELRSANTLVTHCVEQENGEPFIKGED